jgi:streptogramin lyase
LDSPSSIQFGPDGSAYVASFYSNQILRYNGSTGAFLDVFASTGKNYYPSDMRFGPDGNLYVCEYSFTGPSVIDKFNGTTGADMGVFASSSALQVANGITFGPDGNLYISNQTQNDANDSVLRYSGATGAPLLPEPFASSGINAPSGLTFGANGDLYVTGFNSGQVYQFQGSSGALLATVKGGNLSTPVDVRFGPDSNLYVVDYTNKDVLRFDGSTGAYESVFASGNGLNGPNALSFGPAFVPEPGLWGLLAGVSLSVVGLLARRRQCRSAQSQHRH